MKPGFQKLCFGAALLLGLQSGAQAAYVGGNPMSYADPSGLVIEYANHEVTFGMYHSKIIITPDNQAAYVNDARFRQFDAQGRRFATIGAGPVGLLRLAYGVNRDRDVNTPAAFRKTLDLPCEYSNEDEAIQRLFELGNIYNQSRKGYTLIPQNILGVPTGWNSNSFISGIGAAAGFHMPAPGETGFPTPGYQNPLPRRFFGP
jgi:hypothetical protein